jgi:hypothetical protein
MKWLAGLGSAAFTESSAYATSSQGTKADSAATAAALTSYARLGSNSYFSSVTLHSDAYFEGDLFLKGSTYPTTSPISGSYVILDNQDFTPSVGWYTFGFDNKYFGTFGSGPFSGSVKLFNGDFELYETSRVLYWKKY